ncbi:MAG: hypothetical protein M1840_000737 [Geoglossum simile]|nr:MAG: hypothetical protein M1840_000737 [Geoglossum simile]
MSRANIVVVGAGVCGLTSALLLARRNPGYKITIVAKHMPGDYDAEYASPWAGANYMPTSLRGTEAAEWDRNTWYEFYHLAEEVPEAGVHFQGREILYQWLRTIVIEQSVCPVDLVVYSREKDAHSVASDWLAELLSADPWFKDMVPNFHVVPKEKLPSGIDSATAWKSVCINTALYLPWLVSQCLRNSVVIKRGVLGHISEAAGLHDTGRKADLVVNCTGLLASQLGGVMDKNVVPVRGQVVVVRNDPGIMTTISGTDDGDDEVTYVMHRAAGGGTVLGGSYEKGKTDPVPDTNLAQRIMERCVKLAPGLTNGKGAEALSIVRHAVGFRPLRIGGVRLEKEKIGGVWIVHNYGHGGFGYQSSYGCSQVVVKLVEEALGVRTRL